MALVTVPGGSTPIGQVFGNSNNSFVASQIATAIAQAALAHNLDLRSVTVPGAVVPPPFNPGGVNELVISAGGDYSIPSSTSSDNPDYVVVLNSTDPVTIHGAPNSSIWGGAGQVTIVDPATVTLSEGAHNPVVNLIGDGDLLAANDSAETVTASGANDTILAGGGQSNITLSGGSALVSGSTVVGHAGGLDVVDNGFDDTISSGSASAAVTLGASASGALVSGGTGALSVVDNGFSDTINAGSGFTAITAPGGSNAVSALTAAVAPGGTVVNGGPGQLNFVGGAGNNTIFGGSGDETVSGGTGDTTLFGGAGGSIEYVDTVSGSLFYQGGSGNETIDASLSKSTNSIYGGSASTNAGSGADTILGGGGANWFFFFKDAVGPSTNQVIGDFSAIDNVMLVGYGPGAIAATSSAGGSTTITLSDNTKITFTGVIDPNALNGHIGQA
jgi:Ca2+-binding RTX toxin-like protein